LSEEEREEIPIEAKEKRETEKIPVEVREEERLQPQIEIKPPRELEEVDVLTPLVDIYLQERGLTDRNQAVAKLVSALNQIGYQVPREVRNVREYVTQMQSILNQIPDTGEDLKGVIASEAALTSSRILKKKLLGGDDMEDMVRLATRMGIIFKAMDHAFQGRTQNQGIPKEVMDKLSSMETELRALREEKRRREIEEKIAKEIAPLKQTIGELKEALKSFKEKPSGETEDKLTKAIEDLKEYLTKSELKELTQTLKQLPEKIGEKTVGRSSVEEVKNVLRDLSTIKTSLETLVGKPSSGAPDWKTVAVQQLGDTIKEILPKLVKGEGEGEEERELSLQDVIDQKVLEYAVNAQIYGNGVIYWDKCAKTLGLTPLQVYQSIQRLCDKGVLNREKLRFIKPKKEKPEEVKKPEPEKKPEEVKKSKETEKIEEKKESEKEGKKGTSEWESYVQSQSTS